MRFGVVDDFAIIGEGLETVLLAQERLARTPDGRGALGGASLRVGNSGRVASIDHRR